MYKHVIRHQSALTFTRGDLKRVVHIEKKGRSDRGYKWNMRGARVLPEPVGASSHSFLLEFGDQNIIINVRDMIGKIMLLIDLDDDIRVSVEKSLQKT